MVLFYISYNGSYLFNVNNSLLCIRNKIPVELDDQVVILPQYFWQKIDEKKW